MLFALGSCKFANISTYTIVMLVVWLALSFGFCRVTCLMVECVGGGVMFGGPIVIHPFSCDFLNLFWFVVIPHFRKINKFVSLFVCVELTLFCWSAPLICPGFSFASRTVLSLELVEVVRATINTAHFQLEHNITWSVYLRLLEFCWQRDETCFVAASILCIV